MKLKSEDGMAEMYINKLDSKGLEVHEMVWLLTDIVSRIQRLEEHGSKEFTENSDN